MRGKKKSAKPSMVVAMTHGVGQEGKVGDVGQVGKVGEVGQEGKVGDGDGVPVLTAEMLKVGEAGEVGQVSHVEGEGVPVLTAEMLKHGLQDGIGASKLMWESPMLQRTVSGERRGRIRMKMRHGSRISEELSIVALSRERSNFVSVFKVLGSPTEGMKRETANE